MPDRNQAARGPQKGSFNLRSKLGAFEWGGMMPDTDNGSLPMNRLAYLVNGRFRGGDVIPRGGQTKINATPLQDPNATVDGLFDFQVGTRRSLYVFGDGCPGISSNVGFNLGWFDFEQFPSYQPGLYFGTLAVALHGAAYASDLYLAQDNNVRKLKLVDAPYGKSALGISGTSQDITVLTLAGFTSIPTLLAHDGRLLIAAALGVGTSAVFSWDGVTKRDDLTAINPPTGMGIWRDRAILGYGGAPNHIRVRSAGSSPGTWATVNPAAGAVVYKEGVSYRDVFYFTSGGSDIWSYDGTTLQVARNIAGAITFGIANFNGFLFVAYTAAGRAKIARYDGAVWVDVHKDLTTQDALIIAARPLIDYRGELWVGVLRNPAPSGFLYHSVGSATAGAWTQQPLDQLAFNGDIQQLVVF